MILNDDVEHHSFANIFPKKQNSVLTIFMYLKTKVQVMMVGGNIFSSLMS